MRILRTPYQGFMADNDMFAYYPDWSLSTATLRNEATILGRLGRDRHLVGLNGSTPPEQVASVFNPNSKTVTVQTTNLLLYSEEFDNASWTKSNASVTPDAVMALDGNLTADKLVEDATSNVHYVLQTVSKSATQITYTASFHARPDGRNFVRAYLFSGVSTNRIDVTVNLLTGAIAYVTSNGTWTLGSCSVVALYNGWYRISITGLSDTATSVRLLIATSSGPAAGDSIYLGDGLSGIFVWGAQVEAATSVGPYVPTTTTSAIGPFATGGRSWSGAVSTVGDTPNDSGYISNASVGFAAAFWHKFSSGSFVCMERSSTPGGTGNNFPILQVVRHADRRFAVRLAVTSSSLASYVTTSPSSVGLFAFEVAPLESKIRLYIDGRLDSEHTGTVNTVAGTNASTRWVIGGSIYNVSGGSYLSSAQDELKGISGEMAFWRRSLGTAKQRALYGGCVQPWDDNVLLASENYEVRTRVLIDDSTGVPQDLTNLDGQDFVDSVDRSLTVDDSTGTASVTLRRRRGRLVDLSPLGTVSDTPYLNLLALRRKVVIERAFVPSGWVIQGWEWEPIFEGAVDSWDLGDETVTLSCSDKSSALRDVFVLDGRAYNYASPNKSAEDAQDEIISDFEPRIPNGTSWTTIGYKNFGKLRVYSEAGTVTTPAFLGSSLMLRYNDVSSGPVIDALQAISDQIGFVTEFKYHEPWAGYRLTTYSPRRTKCIPHQTVQRIGPQDALVEFREPHGLSENMQVTISSSSITTLDRSYSVASVMDFYRATLRATTSSTIASGASIGPSPGTVTFQHNYQLDAAAIVDIAPVRSDISRIRNHAIVRFNRNESTATLSISSVAMASGRVSVTLNSDVTNLDPTGEGVAFTLAGGTGGSAALNGSYSGNVTGPRVVQSDVAGTGAADGTYTTNLPLFSCVHLSFREIMSTASTSLAEYGYLPVAVYEGSNLAINTENEAQRLANTLISDLSAPTAQFTFTSRVKPLELHDIVRLPEDLVRGRWNSEQTVAITGITEKYAAGECVATYEVRLTQPSRGTLWTERILICPERPAAAANYPVDLVDQSTRLALDKAVTFARQFNLIRRSPQRREMGLRNDQTMVWMSTASVGFIPNESNRVGVFRGERIAIDSMGDGTPLTPGVPHYMRFGEMDIFGNVSMITGMGSASTATVPTFVPRFADQTVGAVAAYTSGATRLFVASATWSTATLLTTDNGTDAAGRTYDDYGLYSTASHFFQVPCDGTWLLNHVSSWFGDPTKVGVSVAWYMLVGWLHLRSGATVGFHGENGIEGVGASTPWRLTASAAVTCASGDQLILRLRNASASGYDLINATDNTNGANHMLVSYVLGNQR